MKFSALVISCLLFFLYFFNFTPTSLAQIKIDHTQSIIPTDLQQTSLEQINNPISNTNSDVPNNLHYSTQSIAIEIMSTIICQLSGIDPINPKQSCLGIDQKSGKIGFLPSQKTGGAIGYMGTMITALYTPPLHTADYFQNLASNFGISKKSYAATPGAGFNSLSPLMSIWVAFRNIVYLILVIIFVAIGLAIMLRLKIDPRTVMTIQNQIPKIIVGVLAVTFSFAIAGFLIDLMWVLIYLSYGIFTTIPGFDAAHFNPVSIQGKNALEVAGQIGGGGIAGITDHIATKGVDVINKILGIAPVSNNWNPFNGQITSPLDFLSWLNSITNVFGFGFNLSPASWLINVVSAGLSLFVGFKWMGLQSPSVMGITPGWLGQILIAAPWMYGVYIGANVLIRELLPYLILYLVILVALLTALFRVWFTLIMAYIQILLGVVLAPFWIIGGVIPGSQISLSGWLKNMVANLLAFPVTLIMFMLGSIFIYKFGETQVQGQFVPPLIGDPMSTNTIGTLIGFGVLLMTPNVVNLLKQILKVPKMDTGIGKALAPGLAVPGRAVGGIGGLAFGSAVEKGFMDKSMTDRSPLGRFLRTFGFVR